MDQGERRSQYYTVREAIKINYKLDTSFQSMAQALLYSGFMCSGNIEVQSEVSMR